MKIIMLVVFSLFIANKSEAIPKVGAGKPCDYSSECLGSLMCKGATATTKGKCGAATVGGGYADNLNAAKVSIPTNPRLVTQGLASAVASNGFKTGGGVVETKNCGTGQHMVTNGCKFEKSVPDPADATKWIVTTGWMDCCLDIGVKPDSNKNSGH